MSTHNLLFYMDQQHGDMCLLSDKKKIDWPLLFKNQFMLKAQKTAPKGIPATHAVWHSAISIWFQFDFNTISIWFQWANGIGLLCFGQFYVPSELCFPESCVNIYLCQIHQSMGRLKGLLTQKYTSARSIEKSAEYRHPPLGIFVKLIYWLRRPERNIR